MNKSTRKRLKISEKTGTTSDGKQVNIPPCFVVEGGVFDHDGDYSLIIEKMTFETFNMVKMLCQRIQDQEAPVVALLKKIITPKRIFTVINAADVMGVDIVVKYLGNYLVDNMLIQSEGDWNIALADGGCTEKIAELLKDGGGLPLIEDFNLRLQYYTEAVTRKDIVMVKAMDKEIKRYIFNMKFSELLNGEGLTEDIRRMI